MGEFAARVGRIEPSATLAVRERARRLQADGVDVIDMSAGGPRFETPEHIRAAAIDALERGKTRTTAAAGLPRLREAIARKFRDENDVDATADRVIVTPGSKQALFEAIATLLDPGDEAITIDPSWVSYRAMIGLVGGDRRGVKLDPSTGYALDTATLRSAVSDATRLLVLNTPANPTGSVYSRAALEALRDLAVDHDFWVVCDEIYDKLRFDGVEHVSPASIEGLEDRTVTVNGFSKAYAMTGWRLGYYTGPQAFLDEAAKVHTQTVTAATTFAQYGGIAALEGPQTAQEAMRAGYEARRDAAMAELRRGGVEVPMPKAGFFVFLPLETADDVGVCDRLLEEARVAATPGSAFGVDGYLRLAYPMAEDRVREGVARVIEFLDRPE